MTRPSRPRVRTDRAGGPIEAADGSRPRGAGFWTAMASGWLAYLGLVAFSGAAEGESLAVALPAAVVTTVPAALLGVLVALRSRVLFRPERSLPATVALNFGVGVVYAVLSAAAVTILFAATASVASWPDEWTGQGGIFVFRSIGGFFLYAILAAFLAWTESVRRFEESRALAAREAELRARAELAAIRAQFNPHFVFNTLHSMLLLVRADPPAAERAIEDVAGLIRYADRLRRLDVDMVPLEREVEFCRRYAALEKLRLEDRLRLTWDVPSDAGELGVPAFALQTLLENAVKHAAAPRRRGAEVRVAARREGDSLVVEVVDDGPGLSPDGPRRPGHGLDLLARRVRAIYGDAGDLALSEAPGGGTRARLTIPGRPAPPLAEAGA